jgi:uncharacterized protein YciI
LRSSQSFQTVGGAGLGRRRSTVRFFGGFTESGPIVAVPYDPRPFESPEGAAVHFLLFYNYVPDILERRAQFRGAHIKHAWTAQQRGELILGGALIDPVGSGVLLFSAPSKELIEKFVADDPYVQGGLVTKWSIRQWMTVVGDTASNPIHPDA